MLPWMCVPREFFSVHLIEGKDPKSLFKPLCSLTSSTRHLKSKIVTLVPDYLVDNGSIALDDLNDLNGNMNVLIIRR